MALGDVVWVCQMGPGMILEKQKELFSKVRATAVCGWCVYGDVQDCVGHGEYEIEIYFVCMV